MSPRDGTADTSGENVSSGQPPVSSAAGGGDDGTSPVVVGADDRVGPGEPSVVHAAATIAATTRALSGATNARNLRIDIGAEP
jgi:hypothetical protein